MKRTQLRWIFGLTVLASLSLVGLQAYIWHQGIQQERAQFSRSLQHAVYEAAEEFMRPNESVFIVDENQFEDSLRIKAPGFLLIQIGKADTTFTIDVNDNSLAEIRRHVAFSRNTPQSLGIVEELQRYKFEFPDSAYGLSIEMLSDTISNNFFVRHQRLCPTCNTGFSHLSSTSFKPILENQLSQLGIETEFQWALTHRNGWLVVEGDTAKLEQSDWKLPFFSQRTESSNFPKAVAESHQHGAYASASPVVLLYFPNEHWYLLRSMGPTLLVSSLFAFLVLGCIGYAVFVILQQKQLSEVKTDFINNMTHEFKTPISTIALACEAMQDPQVDLPEGSRKHYLNMIATENDRLGTQVEKVLQMALLDKKDLGLKIEPVDIHELLQEIIDAFSLQLKQRNGTISTSLQAHPFIVQGDAMHLRQMFTNLIDNANKYSSETPDIYVETTNRKGGIEIAIRDKGLGISRDALRKIFDRFYRVPTGNVHDVKGFGLGLSYVQTMAIAHGGHVLAKSKPGVGSTFYLFLPFSYA
ncbi:MAG: HAMP domain-containing histidine kinase [Rhodothermaceae bacterium]|nr:HAMP domain-containing histidine kinase [Rhodothermaceae bacterium]